MPDITFLRDDQRVSITVEKGMSLLEAARKSGILLESPCNGSGSCGKCKVKILQRQDIVLACTEFAEADMTVEILDRQDSHNVQIVQHGADLDIAVDSAVSKRYHPGSHTTEVWIDQVLQGVEPGDTTGESFGLVVDIGTTTLVAALFDLVTGREAASAASLNPQSHHAQDVLSRIKYASGKEGLTVMHTEFISVLNRMIDDLVLQAGIKASRIYELVFSGNTCMLHLALGVDPAPLGRYPYIPAITGGWSYPARDYGIPVNDWAKVYLPPVMSAYVGADITSGILAAGLKQQAGLTLFVDVGTNGEMVLAADGGLIATSTAAGPAFEGMNITYGMRASPGAIEKFMVAGDGTVTLQTIGEREPIGICGSGLLDIVGELVKHGLIQKTGRLQPAPDRPELAGRLVKKDGKTVFAVADAVYLTQKDIRQVQLAKGAIRAGIEALLAKNKVLPEAVHRVYIAGSFGYHLNPESLIHIGMLPQEFHNKIEFLGNTSKTGGQAFLLNHPARQAIRGVVDEVEVLELATMDNFDQLFVRCLNF